LRVKALQKQSGRLATSAFNPNNQTYPFSRQLTKVGGNVGAALLHPPITNYTKLDEAPAKMFNSPQIVGIGRVLG
jgi:hypothetical protein